MRFYADLHVHSRYSRATSRDADLPHLAQWARRKGIAVVGTGDFTHPAYRAELREQLVEAGPGLYALRPAFDTARAGVAGAAAEAPVRFMLSVEIATIYKKGDKTRKVHHLICVPDLEAAERFSTRLASIGNVASDGRPILGLDSRDLLEIVLETAPGGYLIPAHIWTPWFSVLGSKSGFDRIEDCYGDLSEHIFALETGLSSDPPMNWRLSALDRYTLVSNSDAHSPSKLGREACVFEGEPDYFAMRQALETGQGYGGTVEFFPEEGKYHLDGHRKCAVVLEPGETRARDGLCPVCGKPVTVGVMHRVEELADRDEDPIDVGRMAFRSLVPLPELIGEIERVGAASKRVAGIYDRLLGALGPELFVLEQAPLDEVRRLASPLLAEGLGRMRRGEVLRQAGYDGEYGVIRLFDADELEREQKGAWLFDDLPRSRRKQRAPAAPLAGPLPLPTVEQLPRPDTAPPAQTDLEVEGLLAGLDPEQRAAASHLEGPLQIVAGPGSGKTRTLTHRVAHLVAEQGMAPEGIAVLTFTRRAAAELRERLDGLLGDAAARVSIGTFHQLGLRLLRELHDRAGLPETFGVAGRSAQLEVLGEACEVADKAAERLADQIGRLKHGRAGEPRLRTQRLRYDSALRARGWVDLDDLIALPVALLEGDEKLRDRQRRRLTQLCVDEYQDVDPLQVRLLQALVAPGGPICAIGDPDQAIYGFRGAERALFERFADDFGGARVVKLGRSYRLGPRVLRAASQVVEAGDGIPRGLEALAERDDGIVLHAASSERAEAEFVVHSVEQLIGGHSFFSLDSGRSDGDQAEIGFADIAVLYRTDRQADALVEALERSGIPYQRRAHRPLDALPGVTRLVAALDEVEADGELVAQLERAAAALAHDGELDDSVIQAALEALRPLALVCGRDHPALLDALALGQDLDLWDPRADRISLLTLHAAKGLEFAVVFLVGCEDGLLPLRFGPGSGDGAVDEARREEERRLFYVGMTRARQRLILCHARKRLWQGAVQPRTRSPFVDAIAKRLLELSRTRSPRRRRRDDQMPLL